MLYNLLGFAFFSGCFGHLFALFSAAAAPLLESLRPWMGEKVHGGVSLKGGLGRVGRKNYGDSMMTTMYHLSKLYGELG